MTVAQPIADIARAAIACLLERISGAVGSDAPLREIVFQPRFLSGDSCLSLGPVEVPSQASSG